MQQGTGSVDVQWLNGTTSDVLYTGSVANQVTLTVRNGTDGTITLPSGFDPPAIAFYAASLLDLSDSAEIRCITSGWQTLVSSGGTLKLGAGQTVALSGGTNQAVVLTGLIAQPIQNSSASIPISIDVEYSNSSGSQQALLPLTIKVKSPPTPGQQTLRALVGLVADQVTIGVPQTLRLFLVNQSGQAISWSGSAPTFTLTVPTGSGSADLVPAGASIDVTAEDSGNPARWTIGSPQVGSAALSWQLRPSGNILLGTGSEATAVFDMSGVAATTQGVAPLTFGYTGLSGYTDDSATVTVNKLPVPPPLPQILSFTASPEAIDLRTGVNTVTLNYVTSGVVSVAILGVGVFAVDASGTGSVEVPLAESKMLTLVARDALGNTVTQSVTVTVSPSLFDMLPVGSIVMWSGSTGSQPPEGWVACTQENAGPGVPNLSDQFLVGAAPGCGLTQVSAISHKHNVAGFSGQTSWAGSHPHSVGTISYSMEGNVKTFNIHSNGEHHHPFATSSKNTASAPAIAPSGTALIYLVKQW